MQRDGASYPFSRCMSSFGTFHVGHCEIPRKWQQQRKWQWQGQQVEAATAAAATTALAVAFAFAFPFPFFRPRVFAAGTFFVSLSLPAASTTFGAGLRLRLLPDAGKVEHGPK